MNSVRFLWQLLMALGIALTPTSIFANGISFSPPEGNALTPMTVTVTGFVGTNGPVGVSINGAGISAECNTARPCTFQASMGYYSGKQWVTASGMVDGVGVTVSNYFVVRDGHAFINRTCGTNGTKVIVTGYDFGRNMTVSADSVQTQADTNGAFAVSVPLNGAVGPYNFLIHDGVRFVTKQINIVTNGLCEPDVGHVTGAGSGVTITRPGGQPQPLKPGDPINLGDEIRTGAGGGYRMRFSDGTELHMGPNGRQTIDTYSFEPGNGGNDAAVQGLYKGMFKFISGFAKKRDDNVRVQTVYGTIGVRGTEFISRRDPCSTTQEVYLIHGQLAIKPINSTMTNVIDAPATIYYDATNVWTSGLTEENYRALVAELNATNPVTFGSWQIQYFGCTNGNPSATAVADPDGDGVNNYAEFLAQTDPTSNASVFKLLGASQEGDGIRLFWQTHGGITNVVQGAESVGGIYSDISPHLTIPGDADIVTNYLDSSVITNPSARFYRIRLGP